MKIKSILTLIILTFFLQGYEYKYEVPKLDATNNAASRNSKGIMYMEMGYYNAAMTEFKVAISLNPNSPASAAYYNNLGLLYIKINKLIEASECFDKAISLNPVFLEYYKNKVDVLDKSGVIDKFLSRYIKQINQDNKNSNAYLMAGLICAQMGQKANAINYLQQYVAIEKTNVMSRAVKQEIKDLKRLRRK